MHKMGKLQTIDLLTTGKPWANHLLDSFLLLLPMHCLQWHNCLSILPFPVIRRISQGHWWPWWPCGVLHVAMLFFQLNSLSRLCWLSWVASWLACYRYPPHCPQPLLLNPHPIVDHAALLSVKRDSSYIFGGGGSQLMLILYWFWRTSQSWELEFKLDQRGTNLRCWLNQ